MMRWMWLGLGLVVAACGPYRATMVGSEMRDTEFSLQAEEQHLEQSIVGPIDLAAGRYQVPKDSITGGLGESYAVIGIRFPFRIGDAEGGLASATGEMTRALQQVGAVRSQRRVDGPGFVGTELVVDGATPPHDGRTLIVRVHVTEDALFMLVAAADRRREGSREGNYFAAKRERFFGAFRAGSRGQNAPVRQLTDTETQAVMKRLTTVGAI